MRSILVGVCLRKNHPSIRAWFGHKAVGFSCVHPRTREKHVPLRQTSPRTFLLLMLGMVGHATFDVEVGDALASDEGDDSNQRDDGEDDDDADPEGLAQQVEPQFVRWRSRRGAHQPPARRACGVEANMLHNVQNDTCRDLQETQNTASHIPRVTQQSLCTWNLCVVIRPLCHFVPLGSLAQRVLSMGLPAPMATPKQR